MRNANDPFKTFTNAVALVLAEVLFWVVLLAVWFSVRRVAPNITLDHDAWWPALLALPVTLVLFLVHYGWQKRMALRLADARMLTGMFPRLRPVRNVWRFLIWRTALAAALIGVLDPKIGARLQEVTSEGVDIMVAMDVSNSMLAEDVSMQRMALTRRTVERLIGTLDGDRIGLVVFAGDAYVQCPITTDYAATKLFLDDVTTDIVPVQGTAVGRAIEVAREGFDPESTASKVIVVLTDGENHEDDAVDAAKDAKDAGIEIHTIGMGSPGGGPIPLYDRYGRQRGFKTDAAGNPIVTALDETKLIQIAEAGGGTFTRAGSGFVNLNPITGALQALESAEVATVAYTDYEHRFQWFLWLALGLLLVEMLIGPGRAVGDLATRKLTAVAALAAGLFALQPASGQTSPPTDLTAKAAIIDGLDRFSSGESGADSLFALGESHSELGGVASYNLGRALLDEITQEDADAEALAKEADAAFQRALPLLDNPEDRSSAHHNLGNLKMMQQDFAGAIDSYKKALRENPGNEASRYNLIRAMQELKNQEEQGNEENKEDEGNEETQEDQESQGDEGNEESQEDQESQGDEGNEDEGEEEEQGDEGEGEQGDEEEGEQGSEEEGEQGDEEQGGEEGQEGEGQQQQQPEPVEGQISPEDMERILESLERGESEIRAKLQLQKGDGKKRNIEKDW